MSEGGPPPAPRPVPAVAAHRYGRYVGALAIVLLALIAINTVANAPGGGSVGLAPGRRLPPFATPLASGTLTGDTNVATAANQGRLGRVPACSLRGPEIVNVCDLYARAPLVLMLVTTGGTCTRVLDTAARVLPRFPGVRAAAVSIRGNRAQLRGLVATHSWAFPVGFDRDGVLANEYGVVACPELVFAYPGGVAQGHALLRAPTDAQLSARLTLLVGESRGRGWRPPA